MFKCPECGFEGSVRAAAEVFVLIRDTPDGGVESEEWAEDASHEWDKDSPAWCRKCERFGVVGDFEAPPPAA